MTITDVCLSVHSSSKHYLHRHLHHLHHNLHHHPSSLHSETFKLYSLFSVAKATLQSQMSVTLFVRQQNPSTAWKQHPSSLIIHPSFNPHSFFIALHSSIIIHPSTFILQHSSFIILHSSFLHFATFKLFSLFINLLEILRII